MNAARPAWATDAMLRFLDAVKRCAPDSWEREARRMLERRFPALTTWRAGVVVSYWKRAQ